jgi:hypothetical protein
MFPTNASERDTISYICKSFKVTGVKLYLRRNWNLKKHAVYACSDIVGLNYIMFTKLNVSNK